MIMRHKEKGKKKERRAGVPDLTGHAYSLLNKSPMSAGNSWI